MKAYLVQRPVLVRLFARRSGDPALAEDVIQDLYLRLQALEPGYRVDSPQAFLFRTANNLYLNRLRGLNSERQRNRAWLDVNHAQAGGETVDEQPDAEFRLISRERLALLARSLAELPVRTQDIFRLHKIEGLAQLEVARRLGISVSSVEKHLSSALRHLTARLRSGDGGRGDESMTK